jgi:hypothetical protein
MRIRFQSKESSGKNSTAARNGNPQTGHACDEVVLTTAFLGVVMAFVYVLCSGGLCSIQTIWKNLAANRVVMQKAEALRLFTGSQGCEPNSSLKPLFVEPPDARGLPGNCGGEQYVGYVSAAGPGAGELPSAGHTHMRPVTVTVYWTNYNGSKPVVQSRQVQGRLARNGAPKYIWGAL